MKKIAIFASGSGTNAQNIIEYFSNKKSVAVDSLWSNNEDAYALIRAKKLGIETFIFDRKTLYKSTEILKTLTERKIDMIVLSGFLWLFPDYLTEKFTTVNIHPALLPKYGGKGMFGAHVHESVVKNKEKESGITIHYVNNKYDSGKIIFQAKCSLTPDDTPEIVAQKVHELEYKYFPQIIEKTLMK